MSGFEAWWTHFGGELHAEENVTPKQLARAAFDAAQMNELLQSDWGDGYAEGYRQGVAHQKALRSHTILDELTNQAQQNGEYS